MNKIKFMTGILVMACLVTWLIGTTSDAGSSVPGTVNDPIVTKSYVDQEVGELKAELEARLAELEASGSNSGGTVSEPVVSGDMDMEAINAYIDQKLAAGTDSSLFTVVEATKGQKLIFGASAEVILRAGSATVIAGVNGDGLADLTSGEDLRGSDPVPLQHHLLVSRDDGRGLLIDSEGTSYILVKGAYWIQ